MCHRCFHWIRWCQPLKDKKAKTVLYGFNEIVEESKGQPNKLWVDHGREFYNSPMQKWLHDNDILMYLTHNEGKSVVAEKFIKKLKDKIYKTMTANDSKSYLNYLNTVILITGLLAKSLLMLIILLWLTKLNQIKHLNLKLMIESG